MNLKKFLCLFLLLAVVLTVASCGLTKKYVVAFDSDGGSEVPSQTVKKGKCAVAPADPVKEGYIFVGWYDGDTKWNFSNSISGNLTLVAHWELDTSSCSHVDEDNDGKCDICDIEVGEKFDIVYIDGLRKLKLTPNSYTAVDKNLTLPTPPTKAHYEFVGWCSDEELTNIVTTIDTSAMTDLTFYAKYVPVNYTVTYNLDGGTNSENNPASYDVTDVVITLAAPAKDGYVFRGWYTDNAFTQPITEITKSNAGNLTLYARWASVADVYTITYVDPDGQELATDTYYRSDSDQPLRDIEELDIDLDGYAFISWVDASDSSIYYSCIPAGTAKNIVVKALLKNTATHNILYYVDGAFYFKGVFVEIDGLDTLIEPVKGGYTFDGWYSTSACTGEKVTSIPANIKEDLKLYGKQVPNEYTITYTIDGEVKDLGLGTYTTSDNGTMLPEIPAKNGYTILGWYTADGKLMEENKIAAGSFGNLELEARYEKNVYKITYYMNGGVNSPENVSEYRYDEIPTLHDPLSKNGYKFAGWYIDPLFNGVPIEDLTEYANQDVSLFALWIPDIDGDSSTLTPEVPL